MAVVKAEGFEAALRRLPAKLAAILIYGGDAGAVRELARKAVIKIAGSADDPFNVVRLDEDALAEDLARLADEAGALSMLGGARVVWITNAGEAFLKCIEPILAGPQPASPIVAEAPILAKKSRLRGLFERADNSIIVPVYEDDANALSNLIESILKRNKLTIEPDARARLVSLIGADLALSRQEIEKLVLYCHGQKTIRLEDVEAICGDASAIDTDDAIDAVFTGNAPETDRVLTSLIASGINPDRIVTMSLLHVARLQGFKAEIERGQRADMLLRDARPQIFYKRLPSFHAQLRLWDMEALFSAGTTLQNCVLMMRQYPALAEAIANRTLLALARTAKARQ